MLHVQPINSVIRQILIQNIVGLFGRTLEPVAILDERWGKLVGGPGHEAVEIVETESVGPMIEWAQGGVLPERNVVMLAKHGSVVTVHSQYPRDRRCGFGQR